MKSFAHFGLTALERYTNPGTSGEEENGLPLVRVDLTTEWGEAHARKSFTVEALAGGNVATYDCATGVVSQTTGSPIITKASAVDFQGNAYTDLGPVIGLYIEVDPFAGPVAVACSSNNLPDIPALRPGSKILIALPVDETLQGLGAGTIAFTFGAPNDKITVHLIQIANP